MQIDGIGGAASSTAGETSFDISDIAFAVAVLQLETLDGEIGVRLTDMQHINEIRKAYNDRISALQGYLERTEDGKVWIPPDLLEATGYRWDPEANAGQGGPVPAAIQSVPSPDDARYRVRDADGSEVVLAEILDDPAGRAAWDRESELLVFGLPPGWHPSEENLQRLHAHRIPFRTGSEEEARGIATARGGVVEVEASEDQINREIDRLRDAADNLGADAEIGMLGLNRLLTRRNQVLQLASNVMSSVHQTAMGIIANLKV